MWLMLQQDEPEEFVIATGETHSVREFCDEAFREVGIQLEWQGSGIDEKGIDRDTGRVIIEVDARYFRPTEVELLIGDASKAREKLGWKPRVTFYELVRMMAKADFEAAQKQLQAQSDRPLVMEP